MTLGIAAAYTLFFSILFAQFPLAGALPGNCDTWLNGLAIPNTILNRALAGFDLGEAGTFFYPEKAVFGFGESAFGTSAIFVLFKLIARSDVPAYYLFIVTLFSLNALGAFLLAGFWMRDRLAAAFTGLAFSASSYALGNIDSPHSSFFLVALLALFFLQKHLATGERRALLLAGLLGGAQVWFSAYVFLFMTGAAGLLIVWHLARRGRGTCFDARALVAALLVFFVCAAPFFVFYSQARRNPNFTNPWNSLFLAEVHSLEPSDLLRTLENNLLYPFDRKIVTEDLARRTKWMTEQGVLVPESLTSGDAGIVMGTLSSPDDVKYFVYTRRCAFLGFVLYALAAAGIASTRRWELALHFAVSLLVSFGPFIEIGGTLIPGAAWPAYRWLDASGLLRVPSRAFAFALLAAALAAGAGLERMGSARAFQGRWRRSALFVLACLALLAENVPMPLKSFAGARLATPERVVRDFFEGKQGLVILDLPSRPGGALYGDSGDLFEWNRELIYMNRQTYHHQNILNGVHGYFPASRLRMQELINALPSSEALTALRGAGVQYFVYHHALELPWEAGLFQAISSAPDLRVEASSPEATIFGWSVDSNQIAAGHPWKAMGIGGLHVSDAAGSTELSQRSVEEAESPPAARAVAGSRSSAQPGVSAHAASGDASPRGQQREPRSPLTEARP